MRESMPKQKYEELCEMLQLLEPHTKRMAPKEREFVEQTIAREETYHENIYFSSKQWAWLDQLHDKYAR